MLTNKDIEKIITANKEVFVTKEDFKQFATKEDVVAIKEDTKELKEDVSGLRELVQALTLSVDKLVKAVSDLSHEYAAITAKIDHHEKWIQEIAVKVGVQLKS